MTEKGVVGLDFPYICGKTTEKRVVGLHRERQPGRLQRSGWVDHTTERVDRTGLHREGGG